MKVKMDDLPILPFEKILSYLSLENRIRSRGVSRYWRDCIDSFRVKSLCCSHHRIGLIEEKSRWISGAFAQNVISSPRIASFFSAYGQSILSSLKHLRLWNLKLNAESLPAFTCTLNSFGQLEELDLIWIYKQVGFKLRIDLNLPMLNSIQLQHVPAFKKLTLDAPRLQKVKVCSSSLNLDLVHGESVERLLIYDVGTIEVKKLKNLQYLYVNVLFEIDSTLLFNLKQLKEIHLTKPIKISKLFELKQRYGCANLKIYFNGLLENGSENPTFLPATNFLNLETIDYLNRNPSTLADEIPFQKILDYSIIERVAPELETNFVSRFTDLKLLFIIEPIQDVERFLNLLRNFKNIVQLNFNCDQPQNLFDRLPEHSALQDLTIRSELSDFKFLFGLNDLFSFQTTCSVDVKTVRKLLEELQFLSSFCFMYANKSVVILIDHPSKRFEVSVGRKSTKVSDLNAVIEFITEG